MKFLYFSLFVFLFCFSNIICEICVGKKLKWRHKVSFIGEELSHLALNSSLCRITMLSEKIAFIDDTKHTIEIYNNTSANVLLSLDNLKRVYPGDIIPRGMHFVIATDLDTKKQNLILSLPKLEYPKLTANRQIVIVLLIDSVSDGMLSELYPKLYNYLSNPPNNYSSTKLNNLHVVGHNSPPNKGALYLNDSMLSANYEPIWDIFNKSGFVTAHSDCDCSRKINSIEEDLIEEFYNISDFEQFNYGVITRELVRLYGRFPAKHMMHHRSLCGHRNSCDLNGKCPGSSCIADKPSANHAFKFVTDTIKTFPNNSLFISLNPNELHSISTFYSQFEDWVLEFLNNVIDSGATILALSDHGIHYGKNFQTRQGILHHKYPFGFFLHQNGLFNVNKDINDSIITPYNLYGTLRQIATGEENSWSIISNSFQKRKTCNESLIPDKYCICSLLNNTCADAKLINVARKKFQLFFLKSTSHPFCKNSTDYVSNLKYKSCMGVSTFFTNNEKIYEYQNSLEGEQIVQATSYASDTVKCESQIAKIENRMERIATLNTCQCI